MSLQPDHPIESVTAKELHRLGAEERQAWLAKAFIYWREKGFPHRRLTAAEIVHRYRKISALDTRKIISENRISGSILGLDLANSFHPQIWEAVRWGNLKSPVDHFNDDVTLKKLLERTIALWPDRKCWSAYVIRGIFRIYSGGRVSNFRPAVSKALIERFSVDGDIVLDFCAGFGGRLLGCMPLNRQYIGIDPSSTQISANQKMYDTIKPHAPCKATFHIGCAEEVMPGMRSNSVDLIFTSPPYFKQEKYNRDANQSYLRYKNYDSWKKEFLLPVIAESDRLLKPDGFFVINISNIRNYTLADDFADLAKQYFKLTSYYGLDMLARPVHRKNGASPKAEPVFVFQKRPVEAPGISLLSSPKKYF